MKNLFKCKLVFYYSIFIVKSKLNYIFANGSLTGAVAYEKLT